MDETVERLEFTFDGADEGTPVTGRGWAKAEGKRTHLTMSSALLE